MAEYLTLEELEKLNNKILEAAGLPKEKLFKESPCLTATEVQHRMQAARLELQVLVDRFLRRMI